MLEGVSMSEANRKTPMTATTRGMGGERVFFNNPNPTVSIDRSDLSCCNQTPAGAVSAFSAQ